MPRMKKEIDMSMKSIKLPLTDTQLRKLAKGQGVRVSPSSNCSAYDIWCKAGKCKRMERMMTKGKGFTVKLDPEEMDENVEIEGGRINWKKLGRTLRSTAKSVGKFYREKVRPVVGPEIRKAVSTAIEKGIPLVADAIGVATGNPEIVAAAQPAIQKLAKQASKKGTEKISKLTGAFGMKKPSKTKPKKSKMTKPKPEMEMGGALKVDQGLAKQIHDMEFPKQLPFQAQLQNNYSNFLNPNHPAMNPTLPPPDNSLPIIRSRTHGKGLYVMSEGRGLFMGRGMGMRGLPNDPTLPPIDNSTYIM